MAGTVCSDVQKVKKWDRFESIIENNRTYKDPYRDVELLVTYTKPDNSQVDFWGFYDGGNVWKIRFMPDQIGIWRYKAVFSDGSAKFEGIFECVESDIPGMIYKDETNPMWFGFKGGKHILIRSFHVGDRFFAENWNEEERGDFLDWLQAQGYNMISVASFFLNREKIGRGSGWRTPRLWPLNADEYKKAEKILDDLANRRILVYPFAGFFGRDSYYPTSVKDQETYIRYVIARFGPYWNLLFNVAGPEPLLSKNPFMLKCEINRLGYMIKKYDIFDHLLSVHNATGDDEFLGEPYVSYGILQGPKTTERLVLSEGILKNHSRFYPLYAQETLWAGNIYHPHYSDDDLRKNAYVINMSAAALNFGDMNGDSTSGFSGSLHLNDRVQSRHDIIKKVWDFFETIQFYKMSPRQDLVSKGYCLAEEGKEYLVYLESGGTVNVSISGGKYRVEWINARNTNERINGGFTENGIGLTAPDKEDWLLRLVLE
ncbi:hypothetical protein JOD02_002293 [Caldicoprobacter guelmensis]|uniref:DUF5060 domain-containing protein n=1 Tax=Caldicoprobacter guelmensis TaxID=1170224 RepID=UPI00195E09AE|nr:DUF5060 domain-containing protein [Caldicoprobacter guelmensis]MBM7583411.1 hypothetical protein [Caldicoprobacter guelmensis]